MIKRIFSFSFLFILFFSFNVVSAQEKISDYDVFIKVNADSVLNINEKINYNFGNESRHGILRSIPYKYKRDGLFYNIRIFDIKVTDEKGNNLTKKIFKENDELNIRIGDADIYVTGQKTYIVSYKIKRAINYFEEYDELYWNAIGSDWEVDIKKARIIVELPSLGNQTSLIKNLSAGKTGKSDLKTRCFIGLYGSREEQCKIEDLKNNQIEFLSSAPLDYMNGGMTIVVGWPKGIVPPLSILTIVSDYARDNWFLLFPFIVFFYMLYLWFKHGKDPQGRVTIAPEFIPPSDISPAEIGMLMSEKTRDKDLSAEIIYLATQGYLKITARGGSQSKADQPLTGEKAFGGKNQDQDNKIDYELEKLKDIEESKTIDKKLFSILFSSRKTVKLSDLKKSTSVGMQFENLRNFINKNVTNKKYFSGNPLDVKFSYVFAGILLMVALLVLSIFLFTDILYAYLSGIISGMIVIIFSFFMPKKTYSGVLAKEYLLGLKLYLSVAEKERLRFLNAPEKNPAQFEKLLPYAVALGVETEWAEQFQDIYDQKPDWYSDSFGQSFSSLDFVNLLNSFHSSFAIASIGTPPPNSSLRTSREEGEDSSGFSSGGGFSGGGFGGGGGQSW